VSELDYRDTQVSDAVELPDFCERSQKSSVLAGDEGAEEKQALWFS
jgi:hypothetical protein